MEKTELTFAEALKKINELGYNYIRFAYNGAGDSGDMDRPDLYTTKKDAEQQRIEGLEWKDMYIQLQERYQLASPFLEPIKDKVDSVLNKIEDWWNNDGGFGHIIIDTKTGKYEIENNINIVEQETYNHEGTLE